MSTKDQHWSNVEGGHH